VRLAERTSMARRLLILLGLALVAIAWAAGPERYVCEVRPGPPVEVRVRTIGPEAHRVGPVFSYRYRGKMASAADVDGDGRLDLLVLVYKKTRYDPKPAWRPFVYTLRDDRWVPKWLGSRVGRPLEEAAFVHLPGGVQLLTIERFGPDQSGLTLYHWTGFGFRGAWTGPAGPPMSGLRVLPDESADRISVNVGGRRRVYSYERGGYQPAEKTPPRGEQR
jgi:hypothetical protein